ncbi:hypothetical protein GCM10010924_45150 [Rhizobium wenxiniae]|uniref:Glycine-rich cell wall protein n=1 Tax=Rhizobium wenxiniae TaxID=1737357 RepID=A0A7W9YAB0_9HYPH|nr:hypothetical protein [Rhizobium wenxiniae]MBB6164912.1 hypothetical protein [Rhizobium wenxiniae]GGG11097.1 hypothetical protein GCM10010924_45150 [Rhizobium wenxiniae]
MEVAIRSRRQIISGLMLAFIPGLVSFGAKSAMARNGGQGNGGQGGGNGGGGGGNSGNSGRSGGAESREGNRGRGNRGRSTDTAVEARTTDSLSQKDAVNVDNRGIRVRHGSGIAEEVNDRGRYVMRDRSGRTIVNRAATKSDLDRLRSLIK